MNLLLIFILVTAIFGIVYYMFVLPEKNNYKFTFNKVTEKVKDIADVNNDGKVTTSDAAAAIDEAKKAVKKVRKKYGGKVKKSK